MTPPSPVVPEVLAGTAATATAAAVWPVAVALAAMAVTEQ
jgi:hypothetical protein